MNGRALGVDLGSKRIGIAVCDARRTLASPLTVLQRAGDPAADHRRIADLAAVEEATVIVVGLPIDLMGNQGIAATGVIAEVEAMTPLMPVPVELWDERMTSAAANKFLAGININERKRRTQIDKWAAAGILQSWLDSLGRI